MDTKPEAPGPDTGLSDDYRWFYEHMLTMHGKEPGFDQAFRDGVRPDYDLPTFHAREHQDVTVPLAHEHGRRGAIRKVKPEPVPEGALPLGHIRLPEGVLMGRPTLPRPVVLPDGITVTVTDWIAAVQHPETPNFPMDIDGLRFAYAMQDTYGGDRPAELVLVILDALGLTAKKGTTVRITGTDGVDRIEEAVNVLAGFLAKGNADNAKAWLAADPPFTEVFTCHPDPKVKALLAG